MHFLRNLSSLDILIIWCKSTNNMAFRDFNVQRIKITCIFNWLKENNYYYTNIVIDSEVLKSLSENGPINNWLLQLKDIEDDFNNNDKDMEDSISKNFVFIPLLFSNEEYTIAKTLNQM